MRVVVVPSTFDGAGMYRLLFPGAYVHDHAGVEVLLPPFQHRPDEGSDVIELPSIPGLGPDVVVFQQPIDEGVFFLSRELRKNGVRVLAENDDDFRYLPWYHPAIQSTDPTASPSRNREWLERFLVECDGYSVSTPALAESYRELDPVVIRNRLHWPMWRDIVPVYEQEYRHVRVGWMGGLEWRLADLDVLKPWISEWLLDHPEVEFVAAGDQRVHDYLGVPPAQRVTTARVAFRNMDLAYTTATMNIGLVPLAHNRFNDGKSCLKGMEYAACGIPCLATPTSEYKLWVDDGDTGMLCSSPEEWKAALNLLVNDPGLTEAMGRAARLKAQAHTLDTTWGEWNDWWHGVRPNPDAARTQKTPTAGSRNSREPNGSGPPPDSPGHQEDRPASHEEHARTGSDRERRDLAAPTRR